MSLEQSHPRVVVAIDVGTTFSGFAYARKAEPERVFKCYHWPNAGKAGANPYCKTQTSLFYVPDSEGNFHLSDWGWGAFVQFTQAAQNLRFRNTNVASELPVRRRNSFGLEEANDRIEGSEGKSSFLTSNQSTSFRKNINILNPPEWITERDGYFASKFKLFLAGHVDGIESSATAQKLPGDLTVERLIVDYLRSISGFMITELQSKYGKHFKPADVQWCVTVPAIWDERAKQVMKMCAQKAGLVKGPFCPVDDASPHALDIVLEPEAASVYCQDKVRELNLRKGDKILIADIGGGTIDLVLHSKADDDRDSLKVDEVVKSYGMLGGGTFVDTHFFNFLSRKIGCFESFCHDNPSTAITILGWWQTIKMGFDGPGYSAELLLPRKLSDEWEEHDLKAGRTPSQSYAEMRIHDSDIKQIFDLEVEKVLDLIGRQISGVRVLMLVGGFSGSPYLRKQARDKFGDQVEDIIIPEDPGSAICHGAVQLHLQKDIIQSRIARKTYGFRTSQDALPEDPSELVYLDDHGRRKCRCNFDALIRAGERVSLNRKITRSYSPVFHRQKALTFDLYSSNEIFPTYTNEKEAVLEGSFLIDVSDAMELDIQREVEVCLCFGGSTIQVTAVRKNFGNKNVETPLSVSFLCW